MPNKTVDPKSLLNDALVVVVVIDVVVVVRMIKNAATRLL